MKKTILASTSALIVLLSANVGVSAPAALSNRMPSDFNNLVQVQVRGIDPRPSSELNNRELRERIELLRRAARNNLPNAEQMLRADRRELMARQNGGPSPQQNAPVAERPAPPQQAEEQPVAEQPRRKRGDEPRVEQPRVDQPRVEQPPAQPETVEQVPQPRRKQREQRVDSKPIPANPPAPSRNRADPTVAEFLADNRPSGRLNDNQLRQRISKAGELLAVADRRQVRAIQDLLQSDQAELRNRIQATTGVDVKQFDSNREARRILADNRPAASLNEQQLRERVQTIRGVLAQGDVGPRFENSLRNMLQNDRNELRSRVAAREDRRRPAQTVTRREQPAAQDRRAIRRDLLEARAERQRRLNNRDNVITIDRRSRVSPLPTIPLAEAYDEDVERQLVAPPARPIERRYTLREYRANPSLRTLMPGIEVDTVKFGFNEDFVREEEIAKLDRIGEILERIIAGNPQEVFLIEGHTDLVGSAAYNEALSVRRAAAIRDALTTFFYIPERNIEIVGYGEEYPRIPTEFEEAENRRVTIRRITPILTGSR